MTPHHPACAIEMGYNICNCAALKALDAAGYDDGNGLVFA